VKAENRVLEIIIIDVFDLLPEPDRLLRRPSGIRVETKTVAFARTASQFIGKRAKALA